MYRLCAVATLPEAHMLRDLLAHAGIRAAVFNEHAQGGLGEIPFIHAWPELWLARPEDAARARGVMADIAGVDTTGEAACGHCGETVPAHFECCWQCGRVLR